MLVSNNSKQRQDAEVFTRQLHRERLLSTFHDYSCSTSGTMRMVELLSHYNSLLIKESRRYIQGEYCELISITVLLINCQSLDYNQLLIFVFCGRLVHLPHIMAEIVKHESNQQHIKEGRKFQIDTKDRIVGSSESGSAT